MDGEHATAAVRTLIPARAAACSCVLPRPRSRLKSGTTTSFTYRGDGLRNSRTTGGSTTAFTWDINAGLPVVIDDGTQYVYGAGLVSQISGIGAGRAAGDAIASGAAWTASRVEDIAMATAALAKSLANLAADTANSFRKVLWMSMRAVVNSQLTARWCPRTAGKRNGVASG